MRILLDTNIIHQDYKLSGQRILKLYEASNRLGKEPTKEQVLDYVRQYWGIRIN